VPPYEIFATSTMDEDYLKGIRRFSMHWDRVVNRKWFPGTMALFLANARSPFDVFNRFSLKLADELGLSGFSMLDASRVLLDFMAAEMGIPAEEVRSELRRDYMADGRRLCSPGFLEQRA